MLLQKLLLQNNTNTPINFIMDSWLSGLKRRITNPLNPKRHPGPNHTVPSKFPMKILIAGDSWAMGEGPKTRRWHPSIKD